MVWYFFQQMEKFLLLTSDVLQVKKLHGSAIVYSLKCSVMELMGRNLLSYFFLRSLRNFFLCCDVNGFILQDIFCFIFYSWQVLNREPIFTSLYLGERSFRERSCYVLHSIKQIHTNWHQTRKISCHNRTGVFINVISTWLYVEWSTDNILLKVSFISIVQ